MTSNSPFISISKIEYNELIIDKYQQRFEVDEGSIQELVYKINPHPGFTVKQNYGPSILEKYCNYCDHLSISPVKCCDCCLFYCIKCASLLTSIKQLNKTQFYNESSLLGKPFNCLFDDCNGTKYFESIDLEQKTEMGLIKVNCVYSNCDKFDYYFNMIDHILVCEAGSEYRIDPNLLENFNIDEVENEPISTEFVNKLVNLLDASIANEKTKQIWQEKLSKSFDEMNKRLENINISSSVQKIVNLSFEQQKSQDNQKHLEQEVSLNVPRNKQQLNSDTRQHLKDQLTAPKKSSLNNEHIAKQNLDQQMKLKRSRETTDDWGTDSYCQATLKHDIEKAISLSNEFNKRRRLNSINEQVNSKGFDDDWGSVAYCKAKLNDDIEKAKFLANDFNKRRQLIHYNYQSEKSNNSVFNERLNNVESNTKKVKSIIIVPKQINQTIEPETNHVFTMELNNYHPVGSRVEPRKTANDFKSRSKKLAWKYRQRNAEKVNQKTEMRAMKTYQKRKTEFCQQHLTKLGPPKHFAELISRNVIQLGKDGLNACALDIECIEIENEEEDGSIKIKLVPCWVAIINSNGELTLNEFIRYPQKSIRRMLQSFHGLSWKEIQYAPSFYKVRLQVIEEIKKYKRIIVCNQTVDFAHLMINVKDHRYLLPRIVDVTSYYNCRSNADSIALKYIVFVMFGKIFQSKHHSPLLDAAFTMYLYLIDYYRIEMMMKKISINCTPIRLYHDYRGYIYPPNELFCGLLKDIMKQIKDWPLNIKINVNTKKEIQEKDAIKKSYSQMKLCDHIEEPRPTPYKYVEGKFRFFCHPSTRK